MVSLRKRGNVYDYLFEIAIVEGTRKRITKSGHFIIMKLKHN